MDLSPIECNSDLNAGIQKQMKDQLHVVREGQFIWVWLLRLHVTKDFRVGSAFFGTPKFFFHGSNLPPGGVFCN